MKIVFLFNNEYPGPAPMAKRLALYQRGLAKAGMQADIRAVYRKPSNPLQLYTFPYLVPFDVRKKHGQELEQADIIFVDGFNWFTYFLLRRWYGKRSRLVYELNEKPGTVYTSRVLEFPPIKALGTWLLKKSLKVFDGIVVISEPLVSYINEQKADKAKVLRLPIIIDVHEALPPTSQPLPDHPYIVHSGALSQQKDGILDTIRAFGEVNQRCGHKLHLYITGKGSAPKEVWDQINAMIEQYKLKDNIHFPGLVDEVYLRHLQKNSMCLVLPKPDNEQNRYNFPTKLGEYLVFSRAAIISGVGDMSRYLKHNESALVIRDGDVEGIRDALWAIMNDPALAERIGAGGRKVAEEEFDCGVLGGKLADFFRTIKN